MKRKMRQRIVKRVTKLQRKVVVRLYDEGFSVYQIAKVIRRRKERVAGVIKAVKRADPKEFRVLKKAHERESRKMDVFIKSADYPSELIRRYHKLVGHAYGVAAHSGAHIGLSQRMAQEFKEWREGSE
jgi:hypothetical protein